MQAATDWIDQLIVERELDEFVRYHFKTELMKRAFEARPNATRPERLLIARMIDLAYPKPILHAMDWDTN